MDNIMIRVEIPTPWESQVSKIKHMLDLNDADFLDRYMALLASDLSFPCQPDLEYANVEFEDGKIWADINPNSLPDYLTIKANHKAIDSTLLALVASHINGLGSVDKGAKNYDAIIAHQPKSEWDDKIITAYLWSIIRLVRSSKDIHANLLLSRNAVTLRYIDDLQYDRKPAMARSNAANLGAEYMDVEAVWAVLHQLSNSLEALYKGDSADVRDDHQYKALKQGHDIKEAAKHELSAIIGYAVAASKQETMCNYCGHTNE